MISVSGSNNVDILYHKSDKTNKYEVYGLRVYKIIEDEGSTIVKIDDLDSIINGLLKVKKDIEEFNTLGS